MLGKNKKNKSFIVSTIFLVIIGATTSIITPLMIQYANSNSISLNYKLMILILLSMFISFLLQLFMIIFRENFASHFNVSYLFTLINKLVNVSYDSFVEKESTYLINRILTTVDTLYLFLTSTLPGLIKSIFIMLVALTIIFFLSWKIFILLLLLLPLNYFGYKYINKHLAKKMEAMQKNSASANKDLVTSLSNIDMIKSQSQSNFIEKLLKPEITNMYESLANTNKYAQITSSSITFINQVIQNGTYIWTSIMIINQQMPVENLIILSLLIPMYYNALSDLSKTNIDYKSLQISNNFIKNELDTHTEDDGIYSIKNIDKIVFNEPSFSLDNATFSYSVTQSLEKGDIVYLTGDSGSGKTSLLRLLLKFRSCHGIAINDKNINDITNKSIREKTTYVSQNPFILTTTLEKNIGLGKLLTDQQKHFIEQSNILDSILESKSWDSILYENGANLSGGEKQRIAICRLLINQPELIILDESISNIDAHSAHDIMEFITSKMNDCIIIYTAHDSSYKSYANKIISI